MNHRIFVLVLCQFAAHATMASPDNEPQSAAELPDYSEMTSGPDQRALFACGPYVSSRGAE